MVFINKNDLVSRMLASIKKVYEKPMFPKNFIEKHNEKVRKAYEEHQKDLRDLFEVL